MSTGLPPQARHTPNEEARRRLFELRKRQREGVSITDARVQPLDTAPIPVSFAQEGLWFLDQLGGPGGTYNTAKAVRLLGRIDPSGIERAVQGLLERHHVLRSAFSHVDGVPYQAVRPFAQVANALRIEPETLTVTETKHLDRQVATRLGALAKAPFDLKNPPLLRAHLLRLGPEDHVLLLAAHHIVCDGWSCGILIQEFCALYAHARDSQAFSPPPPLPLQFVDYARWQRRYLTPDVLDRLVRYWRDRLKDLTPLDFPTVHPRPPEASGRGAQIRFELPASLVAQLTVLGRSHQSTLFMVLLAAFQVLLMQRSGRRDVAVGVPVAGRHRVEFERLIGFFANTVVMRADLSGEPTFVEFLSRVRASALDAYAHETLPFDRLVAELSPTRDLGRNPLYQVSFAFQSHRAASFSLPGVVCRAIEPAVTQCKFDMQVALAAMGEGLVGTWDYATDLFESATIEGLIAQFTALLEAVVAAPDASILRLAAGTFGREPSTLTPLKVPAVDRTAAPGANTTLQRRFEDQVRSRPAQVAIHDGDRSISYEQLNARSNQLARYLLGQGLDRGAPIALCMDRTYEMLVAILAIVKAGSPYVPIPADYPPERVKLMLEATRAPLVLTRGPCGLIGARDDLRSIGMDAISAALDACSTEDPETLPNADDLACILFTSGSTGVPKGVLIEHRSILRLVVATNYIQITPKDCIAQASNVGFDAATFEIWGALLNGARLALLPKEVLLDGRLLGAELRRRRVNILFLTTTVFDEHSRHTPEIFRSIDHLLVGGEALSPAAVLRIWDAKPRRLLNVYGPTEVTTFATYHEVRELPTASGIPIGTPVSQTSCYVLDKHQREVLRGAIGELCLGGIGLARGYLNQPELWKERCFRRPCSGELLYRTGDLVRINDEGDLEYHGRIDDQVKIRGFRIEPAEVERAVRQVRHVEHCAVSAERDAQGGLNLVAYVVLAGEANSGAVATIRQDLEHRLPAHMIPSFFVVLPRLPINANGKVDRAALARTRGMQEEAPVGASEQPSDAVEAQLHALWVILLNRRRIGLDENFFDLGGHSLLVVRLVSLLEKTTGISLELSAIFKAPSIRELAAHIRGLASAAPASCVITIQPDGDGPPLFFVPGFLSTSYELKRLAQVVGGRQPLYVLDPHVVVGQSKSPLSLEQIAETMIADLRKLAPSGPYRLAGYSLGGRFVYEIARQLLQDDFPVDLLALVDCSAPGYPKRRSFLRRLVLHVEHATALRFTAMTGYFLSRFWRLRKYVTGAHRRSLAMNYLKRQSDLPPRLERSATLLASAWEAYEPKGYPGRLHLMRAAVRARQPGVIDDDERLGWGRLVTGAIEVVNLPYGHEDLLEEPAVTMVGERLQAFLQPECKRLDTTPG